MSTQPTPWRAGFGMIEPFRKEMEELVSRFFGSGGGDPPATAWAPRVDVEETDKEIVVKADLPGVDPKAVEVTVENGVLTVRGEKKEEKKEERKNFHRVERFTGSFYRSIPLPPGADSEQVTATCSNGVVTISVPKKPEARAKKITVTPDA